MAELLPASGTLVLNGTIGLATAAVFGYVGRIMLRREVHGQDPRLALRLFATWWFSLALLTTMGSLAMFLAAAGIDSLAVHFPLALLGTAPLTVALWSLLYYLIYIYTGNRRLLYPLTVAYAGVFVWFVYVVFWLDPIGVDVGTWSVSLKYAREAELTSYLGGILAAVLLGPILLAALLYATLFFRAQDRGARYRVALVSGAFLMWFGSAGLASFVKIGGETLASLSWWPPVGRIIGLVATMLVLAAYKPPRVVQRLFGVEDVTRPAATRADVRPRARTVAHPALVRSPSATRA
jgi:hypothetical protein